MTRLPGVCIDCRRPVVWNGKRWLDAPVGRGTGRAHECLARPIRKAHSVTVGVSDTPTIRDGPAPADSGRSRTVSSSRGVSARGVSTL